MVSIVNKNIHCRQKKNKKHLNNITKITIIFYEKIIKNCKILIFINSFKHLKHKQNKNRQYKQSFFFRNSQIVFFYNFPLFRKNF